MAQMLITPPFGYGEIQALNHHDHVMLFEPGEIPAFAAKSQILPLTFSEFLAASGHLPIIFIQPAGANHLMPVVMAGLGGELNLFASQETKGKQTKWKWDADTYLPAYVRRHPFCMSALSQNESQANDLLVCVEKAHVSDNLAKHFVRLFDENNAPTECWQLIEQFLQSYQSDIQLTRQFTEELQSLGLFESLEANVSLKGQDDSTKVTGMFGVSETRLNQLEDANIAELSRKGYLPRIYAHLQSLQNFQKLLQRFEAKQLKEKMQKSKNKEMLLS